MAHLIIIDTALPSIVYCDNEIQNTSASTHTFTSKSIGAASPTRVVLIGLCVVGATSLTSVTINGNAAALKVSRTIGSTFFDAIYALSVPTGTTATIVVTSPSSVSCSIGIAAMYDVLSQTPFATAGDSTSGTQSSIDLSLNVPARGVAFAYGFVNANSSWSWTGMTERVDNNASSFTQSVATYTATAAQTPLSVIATCGSTGTGQGVSISFR